MHQHFVTRKPFVTGKATGTMPIPGREVAPGPICKVHRAGERATGSVCVAAGAGDTDRKP